MKKKISDNVAKTFKSNSVHVLINGPFCNKKSGKSHWAVVYVDSGKAYMLKAWFISAYVSFLLQEREKVKKSQVNIDHCNTYYKISIHKNEDGSESLWKCHSPNQAGKTPQPVKRMSFVYSYDTNEENANKEGLIDSTNFFFITMIKCDMNPISPLLLEYLKDHTEGLYKHLMKDEKNEDLVAKKITQDMNQHFSGGYNLHWKDTLNHWLVDFDIIQILKHPMGYTSWSEVPMTQQELCYRSYNRKDLLPNWKIDQKKY